MMVRKFDPASDSLEALATLNEMAPEQQIWWRDALAKRMAPDNTLVAVNLHGELVGMILLYDGGFPSALTEGLFIHPAYRGQGLLRLLVGAVCDELRGRGVSVYFRFGDRASCAKFDTVGVPRVSGASYAMNSVAL
jgi:GNAT superfamily N-acetyltransferase